MNTPQTRHLALDNLTVNLRLARRLSPAVSCRYHALPVAEDHGQVTVAMADPGDTAAREAIMTALGSPLCVVEGDPGSIDALLKEVWPEVLRPSPHLLACVHGSPVADEVSTFARALGDLLDAHVSYYSPLVGNDANCDGLTRVVKQSRYELVIWAEPVQPLSQRLCSGTAQRKAIKRIPTSLLVTRRPRWPLRRLLLLIQDEERDNPAVDWVVRLARPSGAAVTALTVVPPVPALYGRHMCMQQGLDALLTTNTTLGRQMRRVAQQLVDWEVESTLRLRQGIPDQEIRREVTQGEYDLVALAGQPSEWWRRCLLKDWVASLLSWADRPVLIAKPTTI